VHESSCQWSAVLKESLELTSRGAAKSSRSFEPKDHGGTVITISAFVCGKVAGCCSKINTQHTPGQIAYQSKNIPFRIRELRSIIMPKQQPLRSCKTARSAIREAHRLRDGAHHVVQDKFRELALQAYFFGEPGMVSVVEVYEVWVWELEVAGVSEGGSFDGYII
jgi:hypothetical protein